MATPDCDWAGDKVDVFKRGCRAQSTFVVFIDHKNRADRPPCFEPRTVYGCRSHAGTLHAAMARAGQELQRFSKAALVVRVVDITKHPNWRALYGIQENPMGGLVLRG